MRKPLVYITIALAAGFTQVLSALDLEVSGNQEIRVVLNSATSTVSSATFTLTCIETNWMISTIYTNSGGRECIAMVNGRAYTTEWDLAGTACAGLVMDRPSDRLDASTEFVRVLVEAFSTSKQGPITVTNCPVGFLAPRHPGLYCYRPNITWSSEPPFLPETILYRLDESLVGRIRKDEVHYYFRSGYRDQALFRRWVRTQEVGANYSVSAWTNWVGLALPVRAALTHTHFERDGAQPFPRVHLFTVASLQRPTLSDLEPTLLPGSSVQEVADGKCYLYTSTDGKFLPPGQCKSVGKVLTEHPTPAALRALAWAWPFPWGDLLWIGGVFLFLAGTGFGAIVVWRLISSRK